MLVMKSGKQHMTKGVRLPNQEKLRTFGKKETYKYLGIWEANNTKLVEMQEIIKKEYLRRTRKLKTKLYSRNLVKGINIYAVSLSKILTTILKVDQRRTQTNGPDNKKTNDHA